MEKQIWNKGLFYPKKPNSGILSTEVSALNRKLICGGVTDSCQRAAHYQRLDGVPPPRLCSQQRANNQQVNTAKFNTAQNNPDIYTIWCYSAINSIPERGGELQSERINAGRITALTYYHKHITLKQGGSDRWTSAEYRGKLHPQKDHLYVSYSPHVTFHS